MQMSTFAPLDIFIAKRHLTHLKHSGKKRILFGIKKKKNGNQREKEHCAFDTIILMLNDCSAGRQLMVIFERK